MHNCHLFGLSLFVEHNVEYKKTVIAQNSSFDVIRIFHEFSFDQFSFESS